MQNALPSSPAILVHGSYFAANFGDVLLWEILTEELSRLHPKATFLHAGLPAQLVPIYDPSQRFALAGSDASPDLAVFSGGGYFCPPPRAAVRWHLRNFLRHRKALTLARRSRTVAFVGVGFGKLGYSPLGIALRAIPADRTRPVLVRDVESAREFMDLHATSTPAVIDDLAFSWLARTWRRTPNVRIVPQRIAVHMDLAGMSQSQVEHCRRALEALRDQYDGTVRLLTDCDSEQGTRTREFISGVLGRECEEAIFRDDTSAFLTAIADCDRVITTKLHVGICASAMGIPVISIPTHTKTPRFYKKIGLQSALLDQECSQIGALITTPDRHLVSEEVLSASAREYDEVVQHLAGLG